MRLGGTWIALLVTGCSNGDDDHEDDELGPACQDIVDACHEPGGAGDAASEACHEDAHQGDEAVCEAERDACIETCEAAATT